MIGLADGWVNALTSEMVLYIVPQVRIQDKHDVQFIRVQPFKVYVCVQRESS